jgi:translation elongation factor EF-1alpha
MEKELGHITHYYSKIGVAVVEITSGSLKVGETIHVKGHTTDFSQTVESIQQEHQQILEAKKGDSIGLKVEEPVRVGDLVLKGE